MSYFEIIIQDELDYLTLLNVLKEADKDFTPSLSTRTDLNEYAKKIKDNSSIISAYSNKEIIGLIAFYCNDPNKEDSFITFFWIKKEKRGQGIFKNLLCSTEKYLRKAGFRKISLETTLDGRAYHAFKKRGFVEISNSCKDFDGVKKIKMFKKLDL